MRIVVHLEGGLVQSVSSNSPIDAEVVVIDYDTTEGAEQEEIHRVPQSDDPSDVSDACIGWHGDVGTTDNNIVAYLDKIA